MQRKLAEDEQPLSLTRDRIPDFATGKLVENKPEERVRQLFERRIAEEYGYFRSQIEIEFMIQKGSHKIGPADIMIFRDDKKSFDNIYMVIETKRQNQNYRIESS